MSLSKPKAPPSAAPIPPLPPLPCPKPHTPTTPITPLTHTSCRTAPYIPITPPTLLTAGAAASSSRHPHTTRKLHVKSKWRSTKSYGKHSLGRTHIHIQRAIDRARALKVSGEREREPSEDEVPTSCLWRRSASFKASKNHADDEAFSYCSTTSSSKECSSSALFSSPSSSSSSSGRTRLMDAPQRRLLSSKLEKNEDEDKDKDKDEDKDSKKYKCETCEVALSSWNELQQHYAHYNHRACKTRQLQCTICEMRFGSKDKLVSHLKHYHTSTKFVCCPHCDVVLVDGGVKKLKEHVLKEHGEEFCYRCKTVAEDLENLIEHYNDYHLKCKYCKQRFPFLWVHQQKCPARRFVL